MEGQEAKRLKGKKIKRREAETKFNLDGQLVEMFRGLSVEMFENRFIQSYGHTIIQSFKK